MAFNQNMQGAQNQQNMQGAQNQQGGMSGQGAQVTEESLMNLALNETKLMAGSINTYYMTVLGDIYSQQKQLFDCMEQKGYYQLADATAEEVAQTRAKFQNAGN